MARRSSRQRRWNRILAARLLLSLAAGLASPLLVVRRLQNSRQAAEEVTHEAAAMARLRLGVEGQQRAAQDFLIQGSSFARPVLAYDTG